MITDCIEAEIVSQILYRGEAETLHPSTLPRRSRMPSDVILHDILNADGSRTMRRLTEDELLQHAVIAQHVFRRSRGR